MVSLTKYHTSAPLFPCFSMYGMASNKRSSLLADNEVGKYVAVSDHHTSLGEDSVDLLEGKNRDLRLVMFVFQNTNVMQYFTEAEDVNTWAP